MSSVCCVIQCRLESSRLHGKALMDLGGKPLLRHVIDRANAIKGLDDVILAVPDEPTRSRLQMLFPDVRVFAAKTSRPDDVLGRFAEVAREYQSHDVFMRLTGDNPLIDPAIATHVLQEFLNGGLIYHSNLVEQYHDGTDVEVFSRAALMQADASIAQSDPQREHVTPALGQPNVTMHPVKLSVDTLEDLTRVRAIVAKLKAGDYALASTLKAAKAAGV